MGRLIAPFLGKENMHSMIYFASSAFSAFLGFISLPFFTQLMSKPEIGVYGYAIAVNTFILPLLSLSVENYYMKIVFTPDSERDEKRLLGSLVYFIFLWSLAFTGILLLTGPMVFRYSGIYVSFYPTIGIILCSNILSVFTTFALLKFRIRKKAWNYFLLTAFQNIFTTGIALIAVHSFSQTADSRVAGYTIGSLITGGVAYLVLSRQLIFKIDATIVMSALRFAAPLIPYIFSFLLIDLVDRFFLERYSKGNLTELANYNIAFQYANIALMISVSLFRSYEPEFFKLTVQNDHLSLVRKINQFNLINFTCSILLIFTAEFLLNILTHGKFKSSVYLAQWLIVGLFLKSSVLNLNTVLTAMGKNMILMYIAIAGLIVISVISPFYIPEYQSLGTVFLKGGLYLIVFFITWLWFAKKREYIIYLFQTGILLSVLVGSIFICRLMFH